MTYCPRCGMEVAEGPVCPNCGQQQYQFQINNASNGPPDPSPLLMIISFIIVLSIIVPVIIAYSLTRSHTNDSDEYSSEYGDDDQNSDTEISLQLDGELTVSSMTAASLELAHRGGEKVTWSDYRVTVNGTAYTPAQTETSVGEVATFAIATTATTAIMVGEPYVVRVIEISSNTIIWEDRLVAKAVR